MPSHEGYHLEIIYALGTAPISIGGASYEEAQRISIETKAIDAVAKVPRGAITGPGSRHFFRELGRNAGVEQVTVAAFEVYEALVGASREAYVQRLAEQSTEVEEQ